MINGTLSSDNKCSDGMWWYNNFLKSEGELFLAGKE